jgi:hypothetical protein
MSITPLEGDDLPLSVTGGRRREGDFRGIKIAVALVQ